MQAVFSLIEHHGLTGFDDFIRYFLAAFRR